MKKIAAAVVVLLPLLAAADSNIVVNGSFEVGSFLPWGYGSATVVPGASDIGSWSVITNSTAWIGPANPWRLTALDGSKFLDLTEFRSSGSLAGVQQVIPTLTGADYLLTFSIGTQTEFGLPVAIAATAGSASQTFVAANSGNNLWTTYSMPFRANSTSTLLTLAGAGGTLYTGLDNVSVVLLSAVPEPASWLMLLAGCGVIGLTTNRRRTLNVAGSC